MSGRPIGVKRKGDITEVAIYKGDNLLASGTIRKCAKELGCKKQTLFWYLSPTYRKRVAKRSYSDNAIKVIVT
jgi:hypothetical protein